MIKRSQAMGIEINPARVGALFTDKVGDTIRIFCFYTTGEISQFDVPGEENRGNLLGLLSTLNIEETPCTSLIHDEIVQGRIYVQADGQHWLYTLLRSPGQVPPPLNADIADLPWQVCWRSLETEVLRYQEPGGQERCLAVRKRVGESDAERLVKMSRAFTHPVSVTRRQPQRWAHLALGVVLLALGCLIVATLFYTIKSTHRLAGMTPVATATPLPKGMSGSTGYYLLYNHKISGPYPGKVVADMNAGGLFNIDTMCRPEGSTEWSNVVAVFTSSGQ